MKKKEKKYLPLYEKWMESDHLPGLSGLCNAFRKIGMSYYELSENLLTHEEAVKLEGYYASGDKNNDFVGKFTPLRQTILLFLAAMNDEL